MVPSTVKIARLTRPYRVRADSQFIKSKRRDPARRARDCLTQPSKHLHSPRRGPYDLVMELVEGETLAARLKSGPLPLNTALLYASQIAAALAEAHARDIVHRDLKPGNIMIARSGIKVLDFGLARSGQDQTVTGSRTVMGTPGYMAPEQREGKPADARADIYSFGCVLYEVFTGAAAGPRRRRFPSRKLEKIASRVWKKTRGAGGNLSPSCSANWRASPPPQRMADACLPPP